MSAPQSMELMPGNRSANVLTFSDLLRGHRVKSYRVRSTLFVAELDEVRPEFFTLTLPADLRYNQYLYQFVCSYYNGMLKIGDRVRLFLIFQVQELDTGFCFTLLKASVLV